jgi:hypothetical protein
MSVAPKIAVTTDSVLVEQEPSRETRRRLRERKTGPDGLDSKDAEGGAALGDPTSMRSWLSCLDIVEEVFSEDESWSSRTLDFEQKKCFYGTNLKMEPFRRIKSKTSLLSLDL